MTELITNWESLLEDVEIELTEDDEYIIQCAKNELMEKT
jgi:hypothetical protein